MRILAFIIATFMLVMPAAPVSAHDTHADATYMANEAVLVVQGDLKIMFDPFYSSGFGTYA